MKSIIGIDVGYYLFDPINSQISLFDVPAFNVENIALITDVSTGTILYNFADATLGCSLSGDVITLDYNCSLLNPLDRLQIIINFPDKIFEPLEDDPDEDDLFVDPYLDQVPTAIIPSVMGQKPLSQALPVALANEQIFDLQGNLVSLLNPIAGNILAIQDCLQYRSIALQITTGAGISAGVITFEGSNGLDAANTWVALTLIDITSATSVGATSLTLVASTNKYFVGPISFRYFRARVSTTVAGGQVSCLPIYRMSPFSPQLFTGSTAVSLAANQSVNIAQVGNTNTVTGGVAGIQAVGGNIAAGSAPTANPLLIGGVDSSNLVRRILTDNQGSMLPVGPTPANYLLANPLKIKDQDGDVTGRYNQSELLELILYELKLMNYYMKELPMMLNLPNGQFREDISDFDSRNVSSVDKVN
jgi:hypothetical protein